MKLFNIIALSLLTISLSGCATLNSGLGSKLGKPKNVSSSYAPELSAAYSAYEEGRLSMAETLLIQYTNKHPNYTEAWFKLGNLYYRTGQYPAAVTAYQNVIQQQPKHGKAWHNLALTRIRQAEVTLGKGEQQFEPGDVNRLQLTALKNKIRAGVRQYKPVKIKATSVKVKQTQKRVKTTHKPSRYKKRK